MQQIFKQQSKKLKMVSIIELMEENGGQVGQVILDARLQL